MKSYGYRIMYLYRINDFLASSICYTRLQKQIIFYMCSLYPKGYDKSFIK